MLFVAIEGIDGSGKTSLIEALQKRLATEYSCLTIKPASGAPGSFGADLKALIEKHGDEIGEYLKSILFCISFVSAWDSADRRNEVILADRWFDSMLVYQKTQAIIGNFEHNFSGCELRTLEAFERLIIKPDLTIYLHLPAREAWERLADKDDTNHTISRLESVETAYAELYWRSVRSKELAVIDASQTKEAVLQEAAAAIYTYLDRKEK